MWGGTVLIHVLPNVTNRLIHHPDKPDGVFLFGTAASTRITPDNVESSPLPDPHESGERGLASLGERVKIGGIQPRPTHPGTFFSRCCLTPCR